MFRDILSLCHDALSRQALAPRQQKNLTSPRQMLTLCKALLEAPHFLLGTQVTPTLP